MGTCPLPTAHGEDWAIDTGATGDAFAWRHHLERSGLDPDTEQVGFTAIRQYDGRSVMAPVRRANLWIASNLPDTRPFRLPLNRGVAFIDAVVGSPDAQLHRPLIGMSALIRAGLKLEIECASRTVSIWTPGP